MAHDNEISSFNELLNLPSDEKAYAYYPQRKLKGWKLHLCLNEEENIFPELDRPLIRGISKHLIDKKVNHKYANGGDGFKTYTIYTGSMEETLSLACALEENFDLPKTGPDIETSDLFLSNGIYMRFEGQEYKIPGMDYQDGMFMHYGFRGIPRINMSKNFMPEIAHKITGNEKQLLHTLAGHVFCARQYGENYVGKDYDAIRWDKGIFSPLRTKFSQDEITDYVDRAIKSDMPHSINHELKAPAKKLEIKTLVFDRNEGDYQANVASILQKIDQQGSILSRFQCAPHASPKKIKLENILNKF